jgi:hypothetical protein
MWHKKDGHQPNQQWTLDHGYIVSKLNGLVLDIEGGNHQPGVENGQVTYSLPHQAKVVTDSAGTALFLEYKGRKVADV